MFGDPRSSHALQVRAEERARLLGQLPGLSNQALLPFIAAAFATDELVSAYLMPLRSVPRETGEGDPTALSQCLAAMERARRCRTLVLKSSWEPVAVALLVNPCGCYLCLRELMLGCHYRSTPDMYQRIRRVRAEVLSKPLQALCDVDPQIGRYLACLLGSGSYEGLEVRRAVEMQRAVYRETLWMS
ncbi:hypothetical protein AcdelDRAFT_2507 [Acidovorax delafieldii 2AN]|uniref:Uncharacterized protein n=2 Tax=Acidovorax delafieldii TaxID=47920 RepID=C5T6H7_ACIDE|nr:hypothetical protein AcdelDRAFT_2507 [Acidovorax delafieldii 2AN]